MSVPTRRLVSRRLEVGRTSGRLAVAGLLYGGAALAYLIGSGSTSQPPLEAVVAVTVLVAAVLWLVDGPLDRLTARVVLGDQSDGYQVMRTLTQRLADTLPVDEVAPRVAEAASRTTGRPRAEVRLWLTGGARWSQSWPPTTAPIESGTTVGVRHAGAPVGEIAVDTGDTDGTNDTGSGDMLSPLDRRLLDDLARPAGLALSTVRLTVELRQRKADLERLTAALRASRERLLTARAVQQRRMRSEVAARVSPHLAAAVAAVAPRDEAAVSAADLDRACRQAALALDELRAIARGIYPPTLSEDGLGSSLEGWLGRSGLNARLDVPRQLPAIHTRGDLEACLYFSAVTALSELKARQADDVFVTLTDDPEPRLRIVARLTTALADDAIQLVTDRIEAFDGTVAASLDGVHFALEARVPRADSRTP